MKDREIKILVMDKYPVVRIGMRAMLKAKGIRVVGEVGTADETLRLVKARTPGLLLAHVRVSEADSLDFLARIKEKWPRVSIAILTRNEDPAFLSRALALGCSGYIHERAGPQDLLKAIRAIARGECVVEPALLQRLLKDVTQQRVAPTGGPREHFTAPEREVLRLITEGQTNRQIAQRLGYSVGTVKDYVQKIIKKLEVSDRTQAAVKALRLGLLD